MEEIIQNVESIKSWNNKPLPEELISNNAYMHYVMELMSYANYLLKLSASTAPNKEVATRGYTKHKAIIVAHQVRLVKLFHGFSYHVSKCELELASILVRLIYECTI
ncbi:hypothetical protein JYT87_03350 [Nitrospira defluvii]|nr:hypothetical protein [Nitrospira defluvii]